MRITIEAEPKEIAALLLAIKEQPKEVTISQNGKPIKGIIVAIDSLDKPAIHGTQQE